MPKRKHNNVLIIEYLLKGSSLTVIKALTMFRTVELKHYICKLRKLGFVISDKWKSREGKNFKEYYIKKESITKNQEYYESIDLSK